MIPGRIARMSEETQASAATIGPVKSDIVKITGSTQIDNITPFAGGRVWGQQIIMIATDGAITLGGGGNILTGGSMVQNKAVLAVWVPSLAKWAINLTT